MTTYQDTIAWAAEQAWLKWQRNVISWKGTVGDVSAIAFIYGRTAYEVNQDIWAEVIGTFGDPFATAPGELE